MIVYIYNIGVDLYNGFNGLRHRINWTYFTVLDGLAHPLYFYAFGFSQLSTKYETTKPPAMRVVSKNVIQNNHHSFYNEGVQAIKIRKNGDYNG